MASMDIVFRKIGETVGNAILKGISTIYKRNIRQPYNLLLDVVQQPKSPISENKGSILKVELTRVCKFTVPSANF